MCKNEYKKDPNFGSTRKSQEAPQAKEAPEGPQKAPGGPRKTQGPRARRPASGTRITRTNSVVIRLILRE